MRIVENALSISAAFLSFSFSLFLLLHHVSPHQFFYFLSDVASSPLVYFKEMRFSSFFFLFRGPHKGKQSKKCVSSLTPGNRF